jgi:hypothetical protein
MVAEEQIHTAPEGRKIFPMLTEILHRGYYIEMKAELYLP